MMAAYGGLHIAAEGVLPNFNREAPMAYFFDFERRLVPYIIHSWPPL
jgi:hypothetical protein